MIIVWKESEQRQTWIDAALALLRSGAQTEEKLPQGRYSLMKCSTSYECIDGVCVFTLSARRGRQNFPPGLALAPTAVGQNSQQNFKKTDKWNELARLFNSSFYFGFVTVFFWRGHSEDMCWVADLLHRSKYARVSNQPPLIPAG